MDVQMPVMDGYEFVRQLRADTAIATTKVVFYPATFIEREAQVATRDARERVGGLQGSAEVEPLQDRGGRTVRHEHGSAIDGEVAELAHARLGIRVTQALVLPIADHLAFAIQRSRAGSEFIYPLRWEVAQLYPRNWPWDGTRST